MISMILSVFSWFTFVGAYLWSFSGRFFGLFEWNQLSQRCSNICQIFAKNDTSLFLRASIARGKHTLKLKSSCNRYMAEHTTQPIGQIFRLLILLKPTYLYLKVKRTSPRGCKHYRLRRFQHFSLWNYVSLPQIPKLVTCIISVSLLSQLGWVKCDGILSNIGQKTVICVNIGNSCLNSSPQCQSCLFLDP